MLVACAYSARVAVAYVSSGMRTTSNNPFQQLINLGVAVYECESTGACLCVCLCPCDLHWTACKLLGL